MLIILQLKKWNVTLYQEKKERKKLKFKFGTCSYKGKINTTYKTTTEQENII